jgi:hypothetical protein
MKPSSKGSYARSISAPCLLSGLRKLLNTSLDALSYSIL